MKVVEKRSTLTGKTYTSSIDLNVESHVYDLYLNIQNILSPLGNIEEINKAIKIQSN